MCGPADRRVSRPPSGGGGAESGAVRREPTGPQDPRVAPTHASCPDDRSPDIEMDDLDRLDPWVIDGRYTADLPDDLLGRVKIGADDGIRTRDPHLGKDMELVRRVGRTPLSSLSPMSSSAHSAESTDLQRRTFNALNLYQIEIVECSSPSARGRAVGLTSALRSRCRPSSLASASRHMGVARRRGPRRALWGGRRTRLRPGVEHPQRDPTARGYRALRRSVRLCHPPVMWIPSVREASPCGTSGMSDQRRRRALWAVDALGSYDVEHRPVRGVALTSGTYSMCLRSSAANSPITRMMALLALKAARRWVG